MENNDYGLLYDSAVAWKELTEYYYVFTFGYKQQLYTIHLSFPAEKFPHLAGRKHALTPEDNRNIDRMVQQEPDITINELIDKLGLHLCNETVRKAVVNLGYSYKKKSLHASEQERPRCQGKTQKLEKTYVGERHRSPGLSGRKRGKHQYDTALCQSTEKPESSR